MASGTDAHCTPSPLVLCHSVSFSVCHSDHIWASPFPLCATQAGPTVWAVYWYTRVLKLTVSNDASPCARHVDGWWPQAKRSEPHIRQQTCHLYDWPTSSVFSFDTSCTPLSYDNVSWRKRSLRDKSIVRNFPESGARSKNKICLIGTARRMTFMGWKNNRD